MSDLDARLLRAHEAADKAALVRLYEEAANATSDDVVRGFYLTHAYIYALESGAPEVEHLRQRLIAMDREVPS